MLIGGVPTSYFGGVGPSLQSPDPNRGPARSVYSGQDALRRGQDALKSALIASKMPFIVDDAIWNPFCTNF